MNTLKIKQKLFSTLTLTILLVGVGVAAILVGGKYVITKGVFSQSAVETPMSGGGYSVASEMGVSLGRETATGGVYSVSPDKVVVEGIERLASTNLEEAHVYPNPCRVYDGDIAVEFTKLTKQAYVYIYTISGEEVIRLSKNNSDGELTWNLKNEEGEKVASGVYIYIIKSGAMRKKGKLVIIK